MVEGDKLLDEHLHGIGHTLEQAPGTHAVRAEATLEICAYLALIEDVEERQHGINEQQPHAHQQALDCGCQP